VEEEGEEVDESDQGLLASCADDAKLVAFQEKQGVGRTFKQLWKIHKSSSEANHERYALHLSMTSDEAKLLRTMLQEPRRASRRIPQVSSLKLRF
jgi:hypothetical protein